MGPQSGTPLIKIIDTADCGRAAITSQAILQGTIILRESPLLTFLWTRGVPKSDNHANIRAAYRDLTIAQRLRFNKLHVSPARLELHEKQAESYDYHDDTTRLLARVETNCFFLEEDGASHLDGIFYRCSFFNHSCKPNATWSWNRTTKEMEIRARSNIEAGEEISISYINCLYESRSARHKCCGYLGFICKCEMCCEPKDSVMRQDLASWG